MVGRLAQGNGGTWPEPIGWPLVVAYNKRGPLTIYPASPWLCGTRFGRKA